MLQSGHPTSISGCNKYSVLQPQGTVKLEGCNLFLTQKPDYHTPQSMKTERLCNFHPSYYHQLCCSSPAPCPLKRSLICNSNSSKCSTHKHSLRQATSSKNSQDALGVEAVKAIHCFPKVQHQKTEQGKGLAPEMAHSVGPRTQSLSPALRWDQQGRSIPTFEQRH